MTEIEIIRSMTPGSWGVWTLVLIALITLIRGWPKLKEIADASDMALRRDLLEEVRKLRAEVADERHQCDAKIQAQDSAHRQEIDQLHGQIKGLERQLLQLQLSSGQPIALTPASDEAAQRLIQKLKDGQ